MNSRAKILLFDIETSPNLAWVWGKYEQDVIEFNKEWHILAFCAKWLHGKIISRALPDYALYKKNSENDKELIKELWGLFNKADIIIGHNGDKFDIRKSNTRFIEHGLKPPEPYKTIDTLKVAKKYFGFSSNKLDDLARRLKIGRKIKTGGFELWLKCMNKDLKAWKMMKRYNRQDVILLEKIYLQLRPWIENHPNISLLAGKVNGCSACGSYKLQRRGRGINRTGIYPKYCCMVCGKWMNGPYQKLSTIR